MSDPSALQSLLQRCSLGPKHLCEPGPDGATLAQMVAVALRAPDHGELTPFRFVAIAGAARMRLGELFAAVAIDAGKDAASASMEAERAQRAPVTVAVIARIDAGHPQVPAHEQWIAVGGAITNLLNAAHAVGFAGKMLSGHKVRSPRLIQALCEPGETLVGWIAIGTPMRTLRARDKTTWSNVLSMWS